MSENGRVYEGMLNGEGLRFGIVVSRFNEFISSKLLSGALDCLTRHGVDPGQIEVAWVPGALEIPLIAKRMAGGNKYDAVLCLGAVIAGRRRILTMSRLKSPRVWLMCSLTLGSR